MGTHCILILCLHHRSFHPHPPYHFQQNSHTLHPHSHPPPRSFHPHPLYHSQQNGHSMHPHSHPPP
ncbi:hypothetical protein Leryth_008317 [Lithospermum erythrorhizon]|nr:hypothetical protein Leryth_008317 [Lithospermum erythrorhizon]